MPTLAYAMRINAKEIHAIATIFSKFITEYKHHILGTVYKETWKQFKEAVGKNRALGIFWIWTKSLPVNERPDTDPDGN